MAAEVRASTALRRYAEVLLCVGVWMAGGWLLRLDANRYLLLGVPITLLFHRLIRRRPLCALWVRDAPAFHLGRKGVLLAAGLALLPAVQLAVAAISLDAISSGYELAAVAGAVAAAYALCRFHRAALWPLVLCLLVGLALDGVMWTILLELRYAEVRPVQGGMAARVLVGITSLVEYFVVCFALEEVSFRTFDDHLGQQSGGRSVLAALFISALWGLWHLPIVGGADLGTVGGLLMVHVPFGLSLSLFWRRSGNLTVPALSHALGDAIRNAILAAEWQ